MRGRSRGFLGLSTGSLPSDFKPKTSSYAPESYTLSPREKSLIKKHLQFYLSLENGTRQPTTAAQQHFAAVCRERAVPETEHEWAFVKWRAGRR